MPVRQLDLYLGQRGLVKRDLPLTDLSGLRLGVDGLFWLRRLISVSIREPAVLATAGIPLSLHAAVLADVKQWRRHNIHVFIVFPGLPQPWRRDLRPFSAPDTRPRLRAQAWDFNNQGRLDAAMASFASAGNLSAVDMVSVVMQWLNEERIECMRAPFAASAQLAYMDTATMFHAVYSSNDYLLYEVDRVITNVDFQKLSYSVVDKAKVLQDFALNSEQFLDCCILAGFDYISTCPALLEGSSSFAFKSSIDIIMQYGTGYNAVTNHMALPAMQTMNYFALFCRTRCIIYHHLVWSENAVIQPLHAEIAPVDLHEIVGHRFPDDVFFYLTQGLISGQVMNALGTHCMVEPVPLCNGQNPFFKAVLSNDRLLCMRGDAISILVACAGRSHLFRPVALVTWLEPNVDIPLMLRDIQSFLTYWTPPKSTPPVENVIVGSVVDMLRDGAVTRESTGHGFTDSASTDAHMVFGTYGQFLTLRNYVVNDTHELTVLGTALHRACESVGGDSSLVAHFAPCWCLLLEMVLCGVPLLAPPTFDPDLKAVPEIMAADIIVFSRVVSLLSLKYTGVPWTGPLSRDLLEFNSFTKIVSRSMRNLLEMLLLNNTVTAPVAPFVVIAEQDGSTTTSQSPLISVAAQLPYGRDTSTISGVVAKNFLLRTLNNTAAQKHGGGKVASIKTWQALGDELSLTSFVADWDYTAIWEKTMWSFWRGWGVMLDSLVASPQLLAHCLREHECSAIAAVHQTYHLSNARICQAMGMPQ